MSSNDSKNKDSSGDPKDTNTIPVPLVLVGTAVWQNDTKCHQCGVEFAVWSLWPRRHHCRQCGKSFCHEHSAESAAVNAYGPSPQRVCQLCFQSLTAPPPPPPPPPTVAPTKLVLPKGLTLGTSTANEKTDPPNVAPALSTAASPTTATPTPNVPDAPAKTATATPKVPDAPARTATATPKVEAAPAKTTLALPANLTAVAPAPVVSAAVATAVSAAPAAVAAVVGATPLMVASAVAGDSVKKSSPPTMERGLGTLAPAAPSARADRKDEKVEKVDKPLYVVELQLRTYKPSSFELANGDKWVALEENLNPSGHARYLTYRLSADDKSAIRDIRVMSSEGAGASDVDARNRLPRGYEFIFSNLNVGLHSAPITYLCFSRQPGHGKPITACQVQILDKMPYTHPIGFRHVQGDYGGNCNPHAKTHIYLSVAQ